MSVTQQPLSREMDGAPTVSMEDKFATLGLTYDDILLLPEARGEYSSRTKYERLQAKTDGAKRRIRRGSC